MYIDIDCIAKSKYLVVVVLILYMYSTCNIPLCIGPPLPLRLPPSIV